MIKRIRKRKKKKKRKEKEKKKRATFPSDLRQPKAAYNSPKQHLYRVRMKKLRDCEGVYWLRGVARRDVASACGKFAKPFLFSPSSCCTAHKLG